MARKVPLALRVRRVLLGRKGLLVRKVQSALLVRKAIRVRRGRKACLAKPDHRAHQEPLAHKDRKAIPALLVLKVM